MLGALPSEARPDEAEGSPLVTVVGTILGFFEAAGSNRVLGERPDDLPDSGASALRHKPEFAYAEGHDVLEPLDLLTGMVFAAVALASRNERVKLLNSDHRIRVACVSCGRATGPLPKRFA